MSKRDGYRELSMEGLREAVMDELAVQYSRSNIGMEEYDERCGKAAGSSARGELLGLVEDLPAIEMPRDPNQADLPAVAQSNAVYRVNRGRVPERDVVFNVFSGSDIDLSRAALPPEGCVVNVVCVFGGCDIKLPRGVNVDVRGIGVFGGFGKRVEDAEDPNAPVVRVNGIAVFGGCDVRTVKR
jgi:hypothetical protein